jgi:hypothetical protein
MSATWRNVANFCPNRANLVTWFLVCRHTFVSRFSDIDVPRTDEIRLSLVLIPTSNVDLHNRSPQQKAQKKTLPPSPRAASSPLAALSPHIVPALFVCSSICLSIWLVVGVISLPLSSRPVLSCCRVISLRCVLSLRPRVVASRLASSLYRVP